MPLHFKANIRRQHSYGGLLVIKSIWGPLDAHIDQQEIPYVLPTRVSLGRSAHNLPPRSAATLKSPFLQSNQ